MSQLQLSPLVSALKKFTDITAVNFHEFSKKCISTIKKVAYNQQHHREMRKKRILERYKNKLQPIQPRVQAQPAPSSNNENPPEAQESRIARINRIKQAMYNKRNQGEIKKWDEKDIELVIEQFGKELKPQIKGKYPSAPEEKVQKVVIQKWNSIDPIKKEAYIAKVLNKIKLQQKEVDNTKEPSPQQDTQKESPQVKREEMAEENPALQLNQPENRFGEYLNKIRNKEKEQQQDQLTEEMNQENPKEKQEPAVVSHHNNDSEKNPLRKQTALKESSNKDPEQVCSKIQQEDYDNQ